VDFQGCHVRRVYSGRDPFRFAIDGCRIPAEESSIEASPKPSQLPTARLYPHSKVNSGLPTISEHLLTPHSLTFSIILGVIVLTPSQEVTCSFTSFLGTVCAPTHIVDF
jgi:hypothetical protein